MHKDVAVIGYEHGFAHDLAAALEARHVIVPDAGDDAVLTQWRAQMEAASRAKNIVVALFPALRPQAAVCALDLGEWEQRAERPLLHWSIALGAAALLCEDGGAIVAVVDAPPPLDAAGFAPEASVAQGVGALARSLALSEGKRHARVNMVATPARLITSPIIAPAPPLPGFPGRLDEDVLAMVRLLLSPDAAYLSGHILSADRGRSW